MNAEVLDQLYGISDSTRDEERIKNVTNIKLESGFYESFKNTIKQILKNPLNYNILIKIQKIINDYSILYFEKLRLIEDEIRILGSKKIIFKLSNCEWRNDTP